MFLNMIFLNKYRRLLTCFLFALYACTFSEIDLLEKAGSKIFAWAEIDYPCKDHGCGCTSALKCLTDCCCDLPEPSTKSEAWCGTTPTPTPELAIEAPSSCCSNESQDIPSPNAQVSESKSCCGISPLPCGGQRQDFITKIQGPPHLTFSIQAVTSFRYTQKQFPKPEHAFSPLSISLEIAKVPIV